MTKTTVADEQVIVVPVRSNTVQSQTHDPELEDCVSGVR